MRNNHSRFWSSGCQWAKDHFLNILGPAVCKPGIQFVDQGDSATMTCNATNVPKEYMTCVTQGPGNTEEIANCSHVAIQDVSVSDGGYYSCVSMANINETSMASCYLQVICMLWFILIIIHMLFTDWEVRIGRNCAYRLGRYSDRGHSFSQYGPT